MKENNYWFEVGKHCDKKKKLLIMSNFSFCHNVFKIRQSEGALECVSLVGKRVQSSTTRLNGCMNSLSPIKQGIIGRFIYTSLFLTLWSSGMDWIRQRTIQCPSPIFPSLIIYAWKHIKVLGCYTWYWWIVDIIKLDCFNKLSEDEHILLENFDTKS